MDTFTNKFRNFSSRHRRPLLWTGGLLSLYALLGFLFVPWLAERQLVGTLQERLGANAIVEDIDFNPFTFTASVDALKIDAADGTPLLALNRLYVNLNPLRLLLLKLHIAEIILDTPQLHYTRYSQTDDTISRLAQQWTATAEPEPEEEPPADDGLFPVEIVHFQYLNGSIEYRDEVPQTDFATTLGPLNLDVTNTSTLDDAEQGVIDFGTQIEQEATLTWRGDFDLTPLRFTGHLALANFSITTPYRYAQDGLPFVLRDGRVALDFDYEFSLADAAPQLAITSINVQVTGLDAVENGTDTAFLTGGTLALDNASFLYPEMKAQAAALRIDGMNLALLRNSDGSVNLQAMLAALGGGEETAPVAEDESATPLQLTLDEFALTNTTLNFTDQTTATPVVLNIHAEAGLQNFTLVPDSALPFDVSLTLDSGGTLATMGTVQLFPALAVDTSLELADLAFLPLQPYVDEFAQVTLENGSLALSAQLRTNATEALSYEGDMTLNDLQLLDQVRAETLLSLESLHADNIDFSLSSKRADISELILEAFYGRVLIDENGVTNIGNAFSPAVPAAADAQPPEQTAAATNGNDGAEAAPAAETATEGANDAPFAISLGRMQVNAASSDFTDRSLPIVFDTRMVGLNGEISGFSSTSSEPMDLRLEGQVDEYGLVEIMGALNPLDIAEQTTIELAFSNLELPAMTPYVIKFAGREIAEGKADVTLQYTIDDGALQANNSLILSDLQLGERVDYPDAMDLPLDLAVALLKNRDGIIDLNVPITGNVDDPQFDLGPVIRQAVFNVLGNIVTAPFRFLASLIGGDSEEMERIRFRPGRSDLAPPEQEKLQKLQEALLERPQLALEIPAPLASEEDTRELQVSAVNTRIEAQLAQDDSDTQLPERQLEVLESLYTTALLTPTLEELRLQFTQAPDPAAAVDDDEDADEATEPVFDALAYAADLRERLIAAEPVTEQMLQDLARARQQAVSGYLQMGGDIADDRLQNQEVTTAAMEDGWLNAMFEVGVME